MLTAIDSHQCEPYSNPGGNAIICGLSLLLVLAHADWAACSLLFSSLPLRGAYARFARRTQKERILEAYS